MRSGGRLIGLTALEFELLEMLTRVPGRVVMRDEITQALLNRGNNPHDRTLDVHISHLRTKLEGSRARIQTVRGAGYAFTAGSDVSP